jgi:hypothetical protein
MDLSHFAPADRTEHLANRPTPISPPIPQWSKPTSPMQATQPNVSEFRTAVPVPEQKPEAMAARRAASSPPSMPSQEATSESRNIQVRIGKVEIRSNPPAQLVQVPQRKPATWFDDLKMARNYFSRG